MNENETIICKTILIGEGGVGKTCIILRFINNEYQEGTPATTGASFADKILRIKEYNKNLEYKIWDTAGQEKYRGLAKIFYKNADIVILVYDITRRKTFEEVKNYWYEQIRENITRNISKIIFFYLLVIGVAGNKCDLFEEEEVPQNEGELFAQNIGAFFQLTSASQNIGIKELFNDLGKRFLDPNYGVLNQPLETESLKVNNNKTKEKKKGCC